MDKYRVLCLHGYRQNAERFRNRVSSLRRALKSNLEFVFLDGPVVVPSEVASEEQANTNNEDTRELAWWSYDDATRTHAYWEAAASIDYIAEFVRKEGPFDGIFGFSQGGMIASLVLQRQFENPSESPFSFSFGLLIAAAPIDNAEYASTQRVSIPTVHFIGETDAVVAMERSKTLLELYDEPTVFYHPGGHYIPTSKEPKDVLREFVKTLRAADGAK